MNSNPQTKNIKIIKKTATVQPQTATVEPPTATIEPKTKKIKIIKKTATVQPQTQSVKPPAVEPQTTRPLADIYEDYTYFCCMLEAKHNDKGVLKKYPKMPIDWQNTEISKFDNTKNALARITGKKSNITV